MITDFFHDGFKKLVLEALLNHFLIGKLVAFPKNIKNRSIDVLETAHVFNSNQYRIEVCVDLVLNLGEKRLVKVNYSPHIELGT